MTQQENRTGCDDHRIEPSSGQEEAIAHTEASRPDQSRQGAEDDALPLNNAPASDQSRETRERGEELQGALDEIELRAGRRRLGPLLLGVALAVGVIVGGLATFSAVFVLLVGVIR
jgi:hypothetical protein